MRQIKTIVPFGFRNRLAVALGTAALALLPARAQTVSTVLSSNLFQPTAVAVSPLNRYIISDTANNRMVEFNPDSFAFTVLAGGEAAAADGQGSDAGFRSPQGVVALADGVIIADAGNNLIRRMTYQGRVETIAGSLALAREADEFGGNPQNGGHTDGPAASARFRNPSALAVDGDRVYIADTGNRVIRVLDLGARTVSTLNSSGLSLPTGVAVGRNGDIYICDSATHSIKRWRNGQMELIAGRDSVFDSGLRNSAVAANALFRSPRSIYYRESKDELVVVDSGNGLLRTILDISGPSPRVETFANTGTAGFVTPVGIARDAAGIYLVLDSTRNSLHSIITLQSPRIADPRVGIIRIVTDPLTGADVAILEPVTDRTFINDVTIAVSGEFGAVHHYTEGPAPFNPLEPDSIPLPTENSPTAPNFIDPSPSSQVPRTLATPIPVRRVKVISTGREGEERIPSRIVEATFRFEVATPEINSKVTPGAVVFRSATQNAAIWYTLDGSDPVNNTNVNPQVFGPVPNGGSIPLVVRTKNLVIRARAFRENYRPSSVAIAEFSPTNFVPNRITLGFQYGEASSDFVASPGQRFYAPVTLSMLPDAKANGLQFNLAVDPETGPSAPNFDLAFESMLYRRVSDGLFLQIPPRHFVEFRDDIQYFTNVFEGNVTVIAITNRYQVFSNLVFTNISQRMMGVGWIERFGQTNLFNTREQDLISFSIPHDTLFLSTEGRVVAGGFSFRVPTNAVTNNTYIVRVDRPSATADGIGEDIYIQAPGEDDFSVMKAVRRLTVGERRYIAGDVVPFRWFNAGDFGDTNILNNDIAQIHQTVAYGFGYPPPGSDFFDAMDTCCVTTNGVDLGAITSLYDGNDRIINQIGFGDGELDIADLFVSFRRSLDPSLVWYQRYWSNGERQAVAVPNAFRDPSPRLGAQSVRALSVVDSDEAPALRLSIGSARGLPGGTVTLPIAAEVAGGHPLRALMFNVVIEAVEGGVQPGVLSFTSGALGAPSSLFNHQPGKLAAVWLNTDVAGLLGQQLAGSVSFQIPPEAPANAIYRVRLERVSGSPDGIRKFPLTIAGGVVSTLNRPNVATWADGISDEWRVQHFGSLSEPSSHAALDPDNDGLTNMQEFRLGTDPTDASDSLRVRASAATRDLRLKFRTAAGRKYVLEASSSLAPDSWRVVRSEIIGTGAAFELAESPDSPNLYYRLRLKE